MSTIEVLPGFVMLTEGDYPKVEVRRTLPDDPQDTQVVRVNIDEDSFTTFFSVEELRDLIKAIEDVIL